MVPVNSKQLGRLLKTWKEVFGNTPAMVRDAVQKSTLMMDEHKELKEVIYEIAGERDGINRHRLGRWIKRNEGQIVDGLKFVRYSGNSSAEKWQVKSVSTALSLSENQIKNNAIADNYRRESQGE